MKKPVFGKTDNGKSGIWKNHRWSEPTHGKPLVVDPTAGETADGITSD